MEAHWETLLSFVLVVIAIIYLVGFSGTFLITKFVISGNVYLTNEVLTQTFRDVTNSKRWWLLPQNNSLFFSEEEAEKTFTDKYILETIDISKKYPHEIYLTLKERIPGLTYRANGQTFYMDRKGVITEQVTEKPDPRYPLMEDQNAREVELQKEMLPEDFVVFYLSLMERFPENLGLTVTQGKVGEISCSRPEIVKETIVSEDDILQSEEREEKKDNTDSASESNTNTEDKKVKKTVIEVVKETPVACEDLDVYHHLTLKTDKNILLHFTTLDSLDAQIERLNLLLNQHLETLDGLAYIDLRFGNKIYYQ